MGAGYFSWPGIVCNVFQCYLWAQGLVFWLSWSGFVNSWRLFALGTLPVVFLVLRIRAHKIIRVSHALWGPASSGKEGLRKWLLSYYLGHHLSPSFHCVLNISCELCYKLHEERKILFVTCIVPFIRDRAWSMVGAQ